MLQPTNRFTLFDSLRPPEGFSFDACVATTFTLDLKALLALPGIFAFHSDASAVTDAPPVDILHAIRKYASDITILAQAGETSVPPSSKIFGFLENSVVPVTAPRNGVVHPKVWVIRFRSTADSSTSKLRVIVASRNLTFDSSWDAIIRLDEDANGASLQEIAQLFTGLSQNAVSPIATTHADRISSIAIDLQSARFLIPEPFTDLSCHIFGLDGTPAPFPANAKRALIISPFVSDEFFSRVFPHKIDMLVSRIDQLPSIDDVDTIAQRFSFDDGAALEPHDGPIGPAEPLRGLHAKIFAFENGEETRWFVGSANATGAAFRSNVEVLLELVGPQKDVGIDVSLGTNGDDFGIHMLFRPYSPEIDNGVIDDEHTSFDSLRRTIASQQFTGTAEDTGQTWKVTYTSSKTIDLPTDIQIFVWPTNDPQAKRQVHTGAQLHEEFVTTLTDVSGFLGIELRSPDTFCTFCVPVALEGLPADRDTQLMKSLIGNAERFLSYLVALLDDTQDNYGAETALVEGSTRWETGTSFEIPPVLEKMVKAMRSEPHKLLEIQDLVRDLENDNILPSEFMEIWSAVVSVAHRGERA